MKLEVLNSLYQEKKKKILEDESIEFPDFIRELRHSLGMSVNFVSKFCGVSRHIIYRMETGKFLRKPKDNRTKKLSLLYDVPQKKLDRKLHRFFSKKTDCK